MMDNKALFKIGYGLYVLTAKDGEKDNGCIINTLLQVTDSPLSGVIAVNKRNYTHDMIVKTKEFNISILTTETPFDVFNNFGFKSGRNINKFLDNASIKRTKNNIAYLPDHSNAYLSFKITDTIDLGSHSMFRAEITDGEVLSNAESLTYAYYHQHIKPKPGEQKRGYRCTVCGYIHDSDTLPEDFVCPLCNHGAKFFERV
ncbi:MAG: flavin reductase [Treponema sp.]|jgi:flavin reductase (DIM6/NTAB) family NADH-FMN oxidoreductase RutF|nr:flavin reductase [Treponema sp.]